MIELHLQLGACTVVKAHIACFFEQFSGLFIQTGQRHLVVLQVGQQGSQPF